MLFFLPLQKDIHKSEKKLFEVWGRDFFCPLLMHNSSNMIWPRCSFPPPALSSMNLASVRCRGSHSPAPYWSKRWENWSSPGGLNNSKHHHSLPASQVAERGVQPLMQFDYDTSQAFSWHKPHTHKLSWQQKGEEGMNNFAKVFNLTFIVNNLVQRQKPSDLCGTGKTEVGSHFWKQC